MKYDDVLLRVMRREESREIEARERARKIEEFAESLGLNGFVREMRKNRTILTTYVQDYDVQRRLYASSARDARGSKEGDEENLALFRDVLMLLMGEQEQIHPEAAERFRWRPPEFFIRRMSYDDAYVVVMRDEDSPFYIFSVLRAGETLATGVLDQADAYLIFWNRVPPEVVIASAYIHVRSLVTELLDAMPRELLTATGIRSIEVREHMKFPYLRVHFSDGKSVDIGINLEDLSLLLNGMRRSVAQEIVCRAVTERGHVEVKGQNYRVEFKRRDHGWLVLLTMPGRSVEGVLNCKFIDGDLLFSASRGLEDLALDLVDLLLRVGGVIQATDGTEIEVDISAHVPWCFIRLDIGGMMLEYKAVASGFGRKNVMNVLKEILLGNIARSSIPKILSSRGFSRT